MDAGGMGETGPVLSGRRVKFCNEWYSCGVQ